MTLTYRQRLDITDASGRLRCPGCGRFRREADFPAQSEILEFCGATVTMMTMCRTCMGFEAKETP